MRPPFDPHAPFIASDGLEYENLAQRIKGEPAACWRNGLIQHRREKGHPESQIRAWIKAYDGEDPTPSSALGPPGRTQRLARASLATTGILVD